MGQVAGTLKSVSINGRKFSPPEDVAISMQIGGYDNDVKLNGDKSLRLLKTSMPGKITGIQVACDHTLEDHEFLIGLKDKNEFFDLAVELMSGTIYVGRHQIVGELTEASDTAILAFDTAGSKLTRQ